MRNKWRPKSCTSTTGNLKNVNTTIPVLPNWKYRHLHKELLGQSLFRSMKLIFTVIVKKKKQKKKTLKKQHMS